MNEVKKASQWISQFSEECKTNKKEVCAVRRAENEVKKNDYYKRDESSKTVVPLFVFSI